MSADINELRGIGLTVKYYMKNTMYGNFLAIHFTTKTQGDTGNSPYAYYQRVYQIVSYTDISIFIHKMLNYQMGDQRRHLVNRITVDLDKLHREEAKNKHEKCHSYPMSTMNKLIHKQFYLLYPW